MALPSVLWLGQVPVLLLRAKVGAPAVVIIGGMAIVITMAAAADGTASRIDIAVNPLALNRLRSSISAGVPPL